MKNASRLALGAVSGLFLPAGAALVLGLGPLGCAETAELEEGLPLVTIAECEELGGAPLFDPEDERPLEASCPEGLEAIAEFEEDFYGSEGGVCCSSDEASSDEANRDEPDPDEPATDEPATADDNAPADEVDSTAAAGEG